MSKQYCFFRDRGGLKKINIDEIVCMEITDNYIKFFMNELNEPLSVRATLSAALSKLPANQFLRVSRTYAVSIDHIDEITKDSIVLINVKDHIPVSKEYYPEIIKQINILDAEPPKLRTSRKKKPAPGKS